MIGLLFQLMFFILSLAVRVMILMLALAFYAGVLLLQGLLALVAVAVPATSEAITRWRRSRTLNAGLPSMVGRVGASDAGANAAILKVVERRRSKIER